VLEYYLYHRPAHPGPCLRIAGPWRDELAALAQKRRFSRRGEHPGEVILWTALPGETAPEQMPGEEEGEDAD